jgi:predicted ATP-binding protein involved in virulence
LPKEANWIFLTGENGYGKTCVLQAIALGLYGPNEHFSPHEDIGLFGHALIDTEKQPNLEIDIQFDNLITAERYSYPTRKRNNFKTICAYGASRLSVFTERQSKHEQTPISSLFDNTTVLQNIEHHLYDWFLNKGNQVAQDKYNYTKQLLEELLEGIEIELSTTSKNIWYKETRAGQVYPPVTLNNLAAGYKSLVAMIGDLIIRLFETQPDAVNPAELTGIVIIDELDVHWHPKWQMQLPKLFSKLFPKIQFIVSTHSPIPLLGAPDHSVFLKVNRTSEEGITIARFEKLEKEIHQLTPNLLFSSEIFDFNFLDNLSEAQLDAVYLEDDYDEIERNKEIGEQLRAINEDILPDDLFPQPNS